MKVHILLTALTLVITLPKTALAKDKSCETCDPSTQGWRACTIDKGQPASAFCEVRKDGRKCWKIDEYCGTRKCWYNHCDDHATGDEGGDVSNVFV